MLQGVYLDFLVKNFRNVNYAKSLRTKQKSDFRSLRSRSNAGQVSLTEGSSSGSNQSETENVKSDLNSFCSLTVSNEKYEHYQAKVEIYCKCSRWVVQRRWNGRCGTAPISIYTSHFVDFDHSLLYRIVTNNDNYLVCCIRKILKTLLGRRKF